MPYAPVPYGLCARRGLTQTPPRSAGRRPDGMGGSTPSTRWSTLSTRGSGLVDPAYQRFDNFDDWVGQGIPACIWVGRRCRLAGRHRRRAGMGGSTLSTSGSGRVDVIDPRVDIVDPLVCAGRPGCHGVNGGNMRWCGGESWSKASYKSGCYSWGSTELWIMARLRGRPIFSKVFCT